jgi:hypothetical protein
MQAGRLSWVALFTRADFTDTTGTTVGISSADGAKQPSFAALIAIVHHSPSPSYVG